MTRRAINPVQIFISYRRADTAGHAGHLYDALASRFGEAHVFMDIDAIAPGADFLDDIRNAIAKSDTLVLLIGKQWLAVTDDRGRRKIDGPGDVVRIEVETAMRLGRSIIPVLLQDAEMPAADDLPEPLRPLTRRHALQISDRHWRSDVDQLIGALEKLARERASGPHRHTDGHDQASGSTSPSTAAATPRPDGTAGREASPTRSRVVTHARRPLVFLLTPLALLIGVSGIALLNSSDGSEKHPMKLIFADSFSNAVGGWPQGEAADSTAAYDGGEYRVTVNVPKGWTTLLPGKLGAVSGKIVVEADVRIATYSEGFVGLSCRVGGQGKPFYAGWIDRNGLVQVVRATAALNEDPIVLASEPASRLARSQGVPLHLKLECAGESGKPAALRFSVDGEQVAEGSDPAGLPIGRVGVIAQGSRSERPAEVLFDNFAVRGWSER